MANKTRVIYCLYLYHSRRDRKFRTPAIAIIKYHVTYWIRVTYCSICMSQITFTERVMLNHHVIRSISRVSFVFYSKTNSNIFISQSYTCWKKLNMIREWWLLTNDGYFKYFPTLSKKLNIFFEAVIVPLYKLIAISLHLFDILLQNPCIYCKVFAYFADTQNITL